MDSDLQAWLLAQDFLTWRTSHGMGGARRVEVRKCEGGALLGAGPSLLTALVDAKANDQEMERMGLPVQPLLGLL
jgi:hypothetical protein